MKTGNKYMQLALMQAIAMSSFATPFMTGRNITHIEHEKLKLKGMSAKEMGTSGKNKKRSRKHRD